jgi:hypothetical protein
MQIACKRFDCQKAVEVCYWSCKFRKTCKDWEGALIEIPGVEAIRARLEASAKKSGRAFDPKLLGVPAKKKKQPESGSISSKAPLESRAHPLLAGRLADGPRPKIQRKPPHISPTGKQSLEIKGTMLNPSDTEIDEPDFTASEISTSGSASGKSASAKAKPKAAKPKPAPKPVNNNGPIYLLLFANGKYKELRESELNTEAAGVLKDQTLRLIKGQSLVPQISFKVADEE